MNKPEKKTKPFVIKRTTTEEFSSEPSSADAVIKAAYGAQMPKSAEGGAKKLQEGGMAEGPSHEEGGIPVMQEDTGEQVAEIEGGERVFSVEDTQAMEQAAMEIQKAMDGGDRATAEDLAMRLGFSVVQMIAKQEQIQQSQEGVAPGSQSEQAALQAANQFAQEADQLQTI